MLIFAPNHSASFAGKIVQHLGGTLAPSEEREFDGGEHKMRPLVDVRGQDVYVVHSIHGDARASANDKLCRLLFLIGALKDAGAATVTACLPYLAYARKDRRTQPRDPVTLRYVAAMFEAVGVDRIIVLDVHNDAAFDNAFRCETLRLEAAETFCDSLAASLGDSPVVVASPDVGGVKRAQRFRETLAAKLAREVDFAFMEKRRAGGVVSGETFIGKVDGCDLILCDDLIASGTTILRASAAARSAGAKRVYVAATHAAFTPAALQLFAAAGPESVLVSDSIALPADFASQPTRRLALCSVAPIFARTIAQIEAATAARTRI